MLNLQLKQYIIPENELTSNLANLSSIIMNNFTELNWVGFYLYNSERDRLELGPFQGKPAVSTIRLDQGICGRCATQKKTIVIDDVHQEECHIACDLNSNSELVIPIFTKNKTFFGVLDIDSPKSARFSVEDVKKLEEIIESFSQSIL